MATLTQLEERRRKLRRQYNDLAGRLVTANNRWNDWELKRFRARGTPAEVTAQSHAMDWATKGQSIKRAMAAIGAKDDAVGREMVALIQTAKLARTKPQPRKMHPLSLKYAVKTPIRRR